MLQFEKFEINIKESDFDTVERLNQSLKKVGVDFYLRPFDNDPNRHYLFVCVSDTRFQKATGHNAGRRIDISKMSSDALHITCGEVLDLQDEMSNEEIVQLLGCSRRTFYRYIKKAKETTDRDQLFFF